MASDCINDSILNFLTKLEELLYMHEELTDTDVREAIHLTLTYFFVWGIEDNELPVTFGMFSLEGDEAIAEIINNFLHLVKTCPEIGSVPPGKSRLDLLQNPDIKTPSGYIYDEFLGHVDTPIILDSLPAYLFEAGDYGNY